MEISSHVCSSRSRIFISFEMCKNFPPSDQNLILNTSNLTDETSTEVQKEEKEEEGLVLVVFVVLGIRLGRLRSQSQGGDEEAGTRGEEGEFTCPW